MILEQIGEDVDISGWISVKVWIGVQGQKKVSICYAIAIVATGLDFGDT